MKIDINYNWKFIDDYQEEYLIKMPSNSQIVDIPHTTKLLPYNYFDELEYQKIVTYEKIFSIEEELKDKIIILSFEAFMIKGKIYLNQYYLGEYYSLFNPVDIDISKCIKKGENRLVVVLNTREDSQVPPFGLVVDYLTYGGIYREVSINIHPKIFLKKVLVSANMFGQVKVNPLVNTNDKYKLKHQVFFNNELVKESESNEFFVENPHLWDIKKPNLYTLITTLTSQYGESIMISKFGFRNAIFKKDGFYLNNKKIKLVGLNRHQSYPHVGYAMVKSIQEEDAEILKYESGVNICRTSHYPQSKHFLNRCDEIGLLVINEIPGWQHISEDKNWRNQHYKNVESMIIEEYNHPSLVAHGIRIDESQDDFELYSKSNDIAHQIDPTRQTLGVRNFKNSQLLEDIYAFNDFVCSDLTKGLTNPKKIKTNKHPYLVTEYLGHMEPTKPTDNEKQKVYHALRHAIVLNDNFKYKNLCGAIGWCFVDYYTHIDFGSGDRICPHGVFDMYRNKKYASSIYLSQQDEIPVLEILCNMKPGEYPASCFGDIYVVSNADYIDLYKNDDFIDRFYPNNKKFKYLPHPLFLIDDIIGKSFNDSRFSSKDRKRLSKVLSHIALFGLDSLSIKNKFTIFKILMKYHLKYSDLVDIYNTHIANWGGRAKTYTFKAYKNNQLMMEKQCGASKKFKFKITQKSTQLVNKETYDTTRVIIQYIDEFNNIMPVANLPLTIECEGPIQALCPNQITLLGGQTSIYVRSLNQKGNGVLKIRGNNFYQEVKFEVK